MSDANTETIRSIQQQLTEQEADRKAFYRTVGEVMSKMSDTQKSITSAIDSLVVLQRSQENSLADIKEATAQQSVAINSVAKYSQEVSEYTQHLGEINDVISGISGMEDEINEKVGKLKEIIHGEVIEIEDNMAKTNKLLENKFDEFTELLKKSNTEALVEVMKKVTEEFQKQMNSLINKLIQENFDQLNKSVEKLNQWQQENKEMIASLTYQTRKCPTISRLPLLHFLVSRTIRLHLSAREAGFTSLLMRLIKLSSRTNISLKLPRNSMKLPISPNPIWNRSMNLPKHSMNGYANSATL